MIRRILVEDSPVQTMPKANVAIFPARGKRHRGTAGVKIDFAYDLLAGEVCSHSLHSATEQDKTIGKEFVALVRENDLVLRDMGYFSIGEFIEIELRGAFSKGVEPDAMFMIRDGWHLMITNLPAADFTPNQLRAIYRARRGVELQFLAWKQANNLDKALNRKSGEHHPMAIVLTAMIDHLIGMRTARLLSGQKGVDHLSYENRHDALSIHHQAAKRWEDSLRFTPFMKQVERDKRRKKIPGQHKGFRLRLTRMGSYRTPVLTAASPPVWVKAEEKENSFFAGKSKHGKAEIILQFPSCPFRLGSESL